MADANAWGPDDQIWAMNHVMQETVVPLLKTVERGKIYDLSQVIEMGAPQLLPFMSPFVQSMYCTAGNTRRLFREAMGIVDGCRRQPGACRDDDARRNAYRRFGACCNGKPNI